MEIDPLAEYLREVNELPLLTPELERELWRRVATGGPESETAKRQLVEANLRLVVSVARTYKDRGARLLDIIQEGNLGLMRAVDGFEAEGTTRFSIFATELIRAAIDPAFEAGLGNDPYEP